MAFKDKETGKWVAQWYEPNVYGVNKQKKKRGFKTQREAKQYECDRNLKKQGNLQMSMKVFVEQYFQDKENELKSRTKQNKRYMIDSYLIPYFGDMKMSDIKPAQIIAWQNEIYKKNQKTKDSNKSKFDNVSSTNKNQKTKQNQNNTAGTENISQSLTVTTTAYIWLCGCIVLLVRNLFLIWRTKQTVLMAIRRKDNIYESEYISTPFVLGIVRPKIYIPFNLSEQEREYILKHEQYHIRRKDQIIKICAYILCVIYWFQPLIWFAYFVMIRDMEMSCDEYVLKNSKSDIRAAYSTSLLKLATKTEDFNAGLPAFGESDIRKRVKNIMKFNAKKKWVSVVAAIAVVIVGVSCLTKAAVKTDANNPNKIIAEKKIGPDNNKMTYGDKIDNNIKAADTSNNEKAINNIKDNSTADETDMDSDDIVPITKNIYSIDKINKSGNDILQ